MNTSAIVLAAFLIGMVSGLRTFTAPAIVSWAAFAGVLGLAGTPLAFLGARITPIILTALVVMEWVIDQRPGTASRKTPPQFAVRIASGALCGAAVAAPTGSWVIGLVAGIGGAIAGILGGYGMRQRMAGAFGRDRPAAILEDAIAIAGAVLVVAVLA